MCVFPIIMQNPSHNAMCVFPIIMQNPSHNAMCVFPIIMEFPLHLYKNVSKHNKQRCKYDQLAIRK